MNDVIAGAERHKPPVVLIHGMWSQPEVWANWQARLEAEGYHCLAIRLPGHRVSLDQQARSTLGKTTLRDYVDAAATVIESLVEPPIVMGHSLGGLIAQILATEVSLAAAVLINPAAPGAIFPLRPKTLPGMARHFARPGLWHKAFKLAPIEASYLLFNAMPRQAHAPLLADLVYESGHVAYEVAFGPLNLRHTNRVNKPSISCPMLALAGQRDRIVPVAVSRKLANWYGDALTYWEYPQHAHWLLGEPGWEGIVDRTLKWLEKAPPKGLT
ncbi:alpha/beta hydrolase [Marinobacter caseinilyticus]|uniref:alpha/beta hydrolase n=1 Tax=Marinobacter caseinilyticus TaxID=2692195 RepID=UPI001409CF99|nr:alpha/beta hydrolase [Marinobacter caseinilyticus]